MSKIVYDYIESYLRGLITQNDSLLKDIEDFAKENNVPIIQPEVAKLLSLIIKVKGVKSILEVGTAIGYSALVMHKACGNCKIVTIERNEEMIERAKINIEKAGCQSHITILKGEAEDILPGIDEKFDLIFLDAAKGQYLEFFSVCDRLLNNNGIIFADNVLFRGMVATNELLIRRKITIVKRMRKYLSFMSDNENYDTSILPIGDGVAISYKTGG